MRNYQQTNMVNKVHKNVKYMLSEARQIINIKNKIPLSFDRIILHNQQQSFKNLKSASSQQSQSQRKEQKYKQIKSKGKALKLRTSLQVQDISGFLEDRFQTLSKEQIKQLKLLSHLNKQEMELVQTSRRSIKIGPLVRYNDQLPPISTKRIQRSIAKSSKGCFSFTIEPSQGPKMQKMKKFQTIESISSSNLISYLQKHKKKINPFTVKNKEKEKEKRTNNKYDVQYEPWNNQAEPTDMFFQL